MFQATGLSIDKWTISNVADWVKGLDANICNYHTNFTEHKVDGKRLLMIDHHDLSRMGIEKIGHQELMLESVELLQSLTNDLNSRNLQRLALCVNCRINNLHQILVHQKDSSQFDRSVVSSVGHLVKSLRDMLKWLEKPPFNSIDEFTDLHSHLLKTTLSIIGVFARTSKLQSALREKCSYLIDKLADISGKCDDLIKNCSDPLIIMPASIENVTVRKRSEEPLGLQLVSTPNGVHSIKVIRKNTACDKISKLEPADEIVQVNHQLVIGWQLKNVVAALKEKPKEVILAVKKPPRHFNPQSLMQRRPSPQTGLTLGEDLKQSTFPKRMSKYGGSSDDAAVNSAEQKLKASSISEGTNPGSKTSSTSEVTSTYDDVFSPSSDSLEAPRPTVFEESERRSTVSGASLKKPSRPTILVNDMWDPNNSSSSSNVAGTTDNPPLSLIKASGKKEILSSFHVVKSTPELRTPESELPPSDHVM